MNFYDFTKEYGKETGLYERFLCCYLKHFDSEFTGQERCGPVSGNIDKMKETLLSFKERIISCFDINDLPDFIFFNSSHKWDGHGILIDGKPFVFFNMALMDNNHFKCPGFNLPVHIIHETSHAIHYAVKPEFYPGNYKLPVDCFTKKMIAEGLATYISIRITGCDEHSALTFGFVDLKSYSAWKENCVRQKENYANIIKKIIAGNIYDKTCMDEVYYKLFFVPDTDEGAITRGRFGYFYGMQIVKEVAKTYSLNELLNLSSDNFLGYLENYFCNI